MRGPAWLLTTRGRPELCLKAVEAAYEKCEMSFYLEVYVDEVDKGYDPVRKLVESEGGLYHHEPRKGGLAHSMRWFFERHPRLAHYGWLADDTFPRTKGWNKKLEDHAGRIMFTYADDLWLTKKSMDAVLTGMVYTSGLCWGGDLVRAAGSWELHPEVKQAGIDDAWSWLLRQVGLFRFCPDVVVEHWNWRTNKRPKDLTDEHTRDELGEYVGNDCHLFGRWKEDGRGADAVERVKTLFVDSDEDLSVLLNDLYTRHNYNPTGASNRFAGVQRKNAAIAKKVQAEAIRLIELHTAAGVRKVREKVEEKNDSDRLDLLVRRV